MTQMRCGLKILHRKIRKIKKTPDVVGPAAEGRERAGLQPAVGSPRICVICDICGFLAFR
jgi:hypothetical protein